MALYTMTYIYGHSNSVDKFITFRNADPGIPAVNQYNFTIGSLDIPNNVFPSFDDAFDYYSTQIGGVTDGSVSSRLGEASTIGKFIRISDVYAYDALQEKVDKVTGKGLSTEDYTTSDKSKLAAIAANATNTAAPVNADWNAGSGLAQILNKPTITAPPSNTDGLGEGSTNLYFTNDRARAAYRAYDGTTARTGVFPIFKSATVSSGTVAFHLTSDGTSGGSALFPNGPIQDSVQVIVSDALASYQMSWAWSNGNKTLTVTANKLTTANILTGILGQAQANSASVKLTVWGY